MLPSMHSQCPMVTSNGSGNQQNNTLTPAMLPYSLLSAFYALSSSNIPSPEINEVEKTKTSARSYNPGRPLCLEDRQKIVRLFEEGNRVSHIARLIGVTHSCVSKIMSRYRRTGSVQPRSFRASSSSSSESIENDIYLKSRKQKHDDEQQPLPFSIERILSTDSKPSMTISPLVTHDLAPILRRNDTKLMSR